MRLNRFLPGILMILPMTLGASASFAAGPIDQLVDKATEINTTSPAGEVLEFLDSIESQLAGANLRQRAAVELIRARALALLARFNESFAILDQLLSEPLEADQRLRVVKLAANIALNWYDFEAGFEYLYEALLLQEEVDDPSLRSGVFGQAAYWHAQLGDQAKGLDYAERTLHLARDSGDIREVCVALEKLGQAEEMAGYRDAAMVTYQAGLQACEQAGDPVFFGVMHALVGRLLLRSGQYVEAEPWIQQAIDRLTEAGFEDGVTDTLTNLAELRFAQQRFDEAETLLERVLARTTSGERPQNRADAHRMLASILQQRGQYRQAWEQLSLHVEARERILDLERVRLITFQEVQFDVRHREQELNLLREQARVAALQEEARKQRRLQRQLAYALAATLLVVMLLILLRSLRERRQLRHLSAHDGLTGLLNHTHFFAACLPLLRAAELQRSPLTLILADIDHFKRFNDRHGHLAGDHALREAARCFRAVLAEHGPVGRIGGEEFAACLPAISAEQALALIDDLRNALKRCDLGGIEDSISMSFGMAQALPGESIDSLRGRADAVLYEAKRRGRDCLVVAGAEPQPASLA